MGDSSQEVSEEDFDKAQDIKMEAKQKQRAKEYEGLFAFC